MTNIHDLIDAAQWLLSRLVPDPDPFGRQTYDIPKVSSKTIRAALKEMTTTHLAMQEQYKDFEAIKESHHNDIVNLAAELARVRYVTISSAILRAEWQSRYLEQAS